MSTEAFGEDSFAEHVLAIVDSIPAGKCLTYGDVAALIGSRAARAVGNVLRHSGGGHPWWRVIRSGGHPPLGLEADALQHYLAEGTRLTTSTTTCGYRVEYAVAVWDA